jgi:hypothetical protein
MIKKKAIKKTRTKIKNQTKLNEILNDKIKKIMQRIKNSN